MTRSPQGDRAAGEHRSHSAWFLKAVGVIFLMQLAVNAVRPTVSYRAIDLGAGNLALGLIAAGFGLLSLFCAIPVGRSIDRRGEMPFIVTGMGLVAGVTLLLLLVNTVWALFVSQTLLGLGQVLITVGMQTLIANSGASHRDTRFSTFTVIVSLGQLLGPAVAGLLAEHVELGSNAGPLSLAGSSAFLAAGIASALGWLLAVSNRNAGSVARLSTGPSRSTHIPFARSVGTVLRQPSAPQAMFASIAVISTTDLLVAYLPAYGEAAGLSASTVGLHLAVRAGASIASRILLQPLAQLFGRGPLLVLSTTLPALALAPLTLLDVVPVIFVLVVFAGFGLGLGQPLSLIWITQTAPAKMRGTAAGVRLSGNRLGQVAIPALVGGLVGSTGLAAVFIAMSVMLTGSSILTATGAFAPPEN